MKAAFSKARQKHRKGEGGMKNRRDEGKEGAIRGREAMRTQSVYSFGHARQIIKQKQASSRGGYPTTD